MNGSTELQSLYRMPFIQSANLNGVTNQKDRIPSQFVYPYNSIDFFGKMNSSEKKTGNMSELDPQKHHFGNIAAYRSSIIGKRTC